MKFHSLRSTLLAGLAALGAAFILSSCGGGGAGGNGNQGGPISVSPANGTFYAGVPGIITMSGGRKPYALTSSDPTVLPVPAIVNGNSVEVIPNNPGVVDPGLQPGELLRKTVFVNVRDSTGIIVQATIAVGQNFLTGYGLNLTPTTCPLPLTGPTPVACAGGETAIQMGAIFAGSLGGNRVFRLEVIRGTYSLVHPVTGVSTNSITVNSDHTGLVLGILRVPSGTPTQIAVIRIVDVQTGVYADQAFIINGSGAGITAVPNAITFTGATTTTCGTGTAQILVFDGTPPYTATSTNPVNIVVTPETSATQPGRFTVQAVNPSTCLTATIVIADSRGARVNVVVTTEVGTADPPAPTTITVSPETITLTCGQSGSVSVIGGTGNYSVNSTDPNVTGVISGNTLTVTRAGNLPVLPGGTTVTTVSVTDGASVDTLQVTAPVNCTP